MLVFTISTGKGFFENRYLCSYRKKGDFVYISPYSTAANTHIQYRCMRDVHCLHLVYFFLVCSRRVMYCSNSSESSISKQFSHIYIYYLK